MGLKTVFILAVTTLRMVMPGMPSIPGMNIPGMNTPQKTLTMNLTSDKNVDASSKAACAIPEGLKLGPKVNLVINLPEKATPGEVGDEPGETTKPKKFVIKYYWMCAEVVPEGQPKILDSDKMMQGYNADMGKYMKAHKGTVEAIVDGSYAYWPGSEKDSIKEDSHCPGDYKLTTNYCGGTDFTLAANQDFLAPIDMISPGKNIDLEKTIKIEWKPIPNALAYIISAFGVNDNEMIMWTSAGDPDITADFAGKVMAPNEVKKYIEKGILLPPDKTSCRIPAGIFKNCKSPMLTVTAIGTDKTQEKDGILTQIVVRSNATVMLGGGMEMDMDESAEENNENGDDPADKNTEPTEEASNDNNNDDAADKANKKLDKIDKAKDTINRVKDIFKR